MKDQMSKSFINKLQDGAQFNRNNLGSHAMGSENILQKGDDKKPTPKMTGYQSGKAGMIVPSMSSIERILRKRNADRNSGY